MEQANGANLRVNSVFAFVKSGDQVVRTDEFLHERQMFRRPLATYLVVWGPHLTGMLAQTAGLFVSIRLFKKKSRQGPECPCCRTRDT